MTFVPFNFATHKHVVPYWIIISAKGRTPEYFHPSEDEAAAAYYHECEKAGLSPTERKEYTQ